jgi:hypothetical protein
MVGFGFGITSARAVLDQSNGVEPDFSVFFHGIIFRENPEAVLKIK